MDAKADHRDFIHLEKGAYYGHRKKARKMVPEMILMYTSQSGNT
jgi:hypothetical protein